MAAPTQSRHILDVFPTQHSSIELVIVFLGRQSDIRIQVGENDLEIGNVASRRSMSFLGGEID